MNLIQTSTTTINAYTLPMEIYHRFNMNCLEQKCPEMVDQNLFQACAYTAHDILPQRGRVTAETTS